MFGLNWRFKNSSEQEVKRYSLGISKEEWNLAVKEADDERKRIIFSPIGLVVLLFVLLMVTILLWDMDRRKYLSPAERDYEDFKAEHQYDDVNF